jgi:two-component system OmpR family response regulator
MPKTILLVDDQELMIRVVQSALKTLGAHLPSAKTGEDAVRYIATQEAPDAIVLDYSMPDQDGVETLRQIRALPNGSSIPVIMLTARDQTQIRTAAEGLQVADFITKPFSPNFLQNTLRKLLQS